MTALTVAALHRVVRSVKNYADPASPSWWQWGRVTLRRAIWLTAINVKMTVNE